MLRLVKVATGLGPRAASTSAARWATGARFSPSVPTRECPNEGQTIDYKVGRRRRLDPALLPALLPPVHSQDHLTQSICPPARQLGAVTPGRRVI